MIICQSQRLSHLLLKRETEGLATTVSPLCASFVSAPAGGSPAQAEEDEDHAEESLVAPVEAALFLGDKARPAAPPPFFALLWRLGWSALLPCRLRSAIAIEARSSSPLAFIHHPAAAGCSCPQVKEATDSVADAARRLKDAFVSGMQKATAPLPGTEDGEEEEEGQAVPDGGGARGRRHHHLGEGSMPMDTSTMATGVEGVRDSLESEEWGSAKGPEAQPQLSGVLRAPGQWRKGKQEEEGEKLFSPRSPRSSAARSFVNNEAAGAGAGEEDERWEGEEGEADADAAGAATAGERRAKSPLDRIVEAASMDEIDEGDFPVVP